MSEIIAYEIKLQGKFGNELSVEKIKVFTTKEEADAIAKDIASKNKHLTFRPTTI